MFNVTLLYGFILDVKHKRIRYRLKVAIKAKDKFKLEYTITEFKEEKVEDKDMELEKAERLLKELVSRDSEYLFGLCKFVSLTKFFVR